MKGTAWLVSAGLLLCTVGLGGPARAQEPQQTKYYVGAYGGYGLHEKLSNASGLSKRGVSSEPIYGIKAGFVPSPETTWFNLEAELFYLGDVKVTAYPGTGGNPQMNLTVLALNWIFRYPGERFQPYVGAGPGIMWADGDFRFGSDDVTLSLNLVAGIRMSLAKRFSVFFEYKHTRTSLDFTNLRDGGYRLHAPVAGLLLNF